MSTKQIALSPDGSLVHGSWLLVCLIGFLAILIFNDNQFTYTLDDPYIHLAVAEEISRGNYGVNPHEASSPASSILWPVLLAPFARLPFGDLAPLVLNIAFGSLTAALLLSRFRQLLPSRPDGPCRRYLLRAVLTWAILLVSNAPGLVFTGMEHSLQLLLAVAAVEILLRNINQPTMRWWYWLVFLLGPMVRYEYFTLTAAACGLFALQSRWKLALSLGIASIAPLLLFSGFLVSLGLPALPCSVMAKSAMANSAEGLFATLRMHLNQSLLGNRGLALAFIATVLSGYCLLRPSFDAYSKLALSLIVAGLLHILVGSYGWFHRYEPYILGSLFFGACALILYSLREHSSFVHQRWTALAGISAVIIAYPYLLALPQIPLAANNIYEQQYQMHRFVKEIWKRPVALNDLGWVSFRNEQRVLDLWGLASHEALEARLSNSPPDWVQRLVAEQNVDLAIIYENWFPNRPKTWVKVAELRLSGRLITPASSRVSFFATRPETSKEIESLLEAFKKSLPPGVTLTTRTDRMAQRQQRQTAP